MKRFILFIFFLVPFIVFSQNWNQIGQNIDGEATNDLSGHSVAMSNDGNIVYLLEIETDYGIVNKKLILQ